MKNICETCRLERRCNGTKYCLIEKAQKELFEMAVELAVLQAREAARKKAEKVFCDEKVMRCEHCRWYAARDKRQGECRDVLN